MSRQLNEGFLGFMRAKDVDAAPQFGELRDCVRRSLYYQQLKPYFRFFDQKQLLVLFHEDLKSEKTSAPFGQTQDISTSTSLPPLILVTQQLESGHFPCKNYHAHSGACRSGRLVCFSGPETKTVEGRQPPPGWRLIA